VGADGESHAGDEGQDRENAADFPLQRLRIAREESDRPRGDPPGVDAEKRFDLTHRITWHRLSDAAL
jgi:hypothetical protein